MSAAALNAWSFGMADRREGSLIDPKAVVQILFATLVSGIVAFVAAYLGTQTKTAVLERAVASVEATVGKYATQQEALANEMRARFDGLSTLVNNSNVKAAQDVASLREQIAASNKAQDELRISIKDVSRRTVELHDWQTSRVDGLRDKVATIQGQLNAERKKD